MKKIHVILLLGAILLLGIVLRVHAFTQITTIDSFTWIGGDSFHYYHVASNILEGKGPVIDFILQFWRESSFGENDSLWAPLIPYAMAGAFFLFGQSILVGKLVIFFASLASILVVYFIGKNVYNQNAGFIASFLLCIHPKHVEYSVSILKDNLYFLLFLLAFWFLFLAVKENKLIQWSLFGLFVSLSFLARYMTAILLVTALFVVILKRKDINWKYLLVGLLVFFIVLAPWGMYTYTHFGQPFFSVTKYYTYSTTGWEGMSFESEAPQISDYLQENSFLDIILIKLKLIPLTAYLLPILFNPLIFLFAIPIFLLRDSFSRNLKLYFLLLMCVYFVQFSSQVSFGERVFFALIYTSLIPIGFIISKIPDFVKKNKIKVNPSKVLAVILIILTLSSFVLLQWKLEDLKSYKMQETQEAFGKLGDFVKNNVAEDAIIMTILPADINYFTHRNTVMDPYNFARSKEYDVSKYSERSKEEIKNYGVTHVLIHSKDKEAKKGFRGLNLRLIYSDKEGELFLHEYL